MLRFWMLLIVLAYALVVACGDSASEISAVGEASSETFLTSVTNEVEDTIAEEAVGIA